MRDLLLSVRSALRSGLDSTVYRIGSNPDQSDIFISESEGFLPPGCRFPAVGIKDGGEVPLRRQLCGPETIEEEIKQVVVIVCWAPSLSGTVGAGVVGDATQPGVLGVSADVHAVLFENKLDDELLVAAVERTSIAPSQPVQQVDGRIGQYMTVTYTYVRNKKYTM